MRCTTRKQRLPAQMRGLEFLFNVELDLGIEVGDDHMNHIGRLIFWLCLLVWPTQAVSQTLFCPETVKDDEQNKAQARRYFDLGTSYFNIRKYDKSAEAFVCVIKLVPHSMMARYRLALSYDRLGKIELAKEHYQKILDSTAKEAQPLKAEVKKRLEEFRRQDEEKVTAAKAAAERQAKAEAERQAVAEAERKARQEESAKAEARRRAEKEAEIRARQEEAERERRAEKAAREVAQREIARRKAEAERLEKAYQAHRAKEVAREAARREIAQREIARRKAEAERLERTIREREAARKKAEAGITKKAPPPHPAPTTPAGLTSRWWFWTGIGATVLCAGTAAAMGGLALQEKSEYRASCKTPIVQKNALTM